MTDEPFEGFNVWYERFLIHLSEHLELPYDYLKSKTDVCMNLASMDLMLKTQKDCKHEETKMVRNRYGLGMERCVACDYVVAIW